MLVAQLDTLNVCTGIVIKKTSQFFDKLLPHTASWKTKQVGLPMNSFIITSTDTGYTGGPISRDPQTKMGSAISWNCGRAGIEIQDGGSLNSLIS